MTKTNSQIREEWEKKFDKKFLINYGQGIMGSSLCHDKNECDNETDMEDIKELKSFIGSLLKTQREEMIEKIMKMNTLDVVLDDSDEGYGLKYSKNKDDSELVFKNKIINLIKEQ